MKIVKNEQGKWEANDGENIIVAETYDDIISITMSGSLNKEPEMVDIPSERVEVESNSDIADSMQNISALSGGKLFRPKREDFEEWETNPVMLEYIRKNNLEDMVKENLTHRGFESAEEILTAFNKATQVAIDNINELRVTISSLRSELSILNDPYADEWDEDWDEDGKWDEDEEWDEDEDEDWDEDEEW